MDSDISKISAERIFCAVSQKFFTALKSVSVKNASKHFQPRDAAATVLISADGSQVVLAQRNPQTPFLGGWHAFAGGKVEKSDSEIIVRNCADTETARLIVAAVRETFEEIGVLLVRHDEKMTKGQRASLHDDLVSGRSTFGEILENWDLWIDAEDFEFVGAWTTPEFSPVRFNTRFFAVRCPAAQKPFDACGELSEVDFVAPSDALELWRRGNIVISPPVFLILRELEKISENGLDNQEKAFEKLRECSMQTGGAIDSIAINSRVVQFPLRTESLPPATHTNCFIVGNKRFVVVDAASPLVAEQEKLQQFIDKLIAKGASPAAILTTHSHSDHIGGETVLQNHLREKFGLKIPLAAHRATAEKLRGKIEFQRLLEDGETFDLLDDRSESFDLEVLHTRGHADGLLCFFDRQMGLLLAGDNVSSYGSVGVFAPEGDMKAYLESLERLKNLPNLRFLCGSHGAAVFDGKGKIESFIAHRRQREAEILQALKDGARTNAEIVKVVYPQLEGDLQSLAEKNVQAHLNKLRDENALENTADF